MNTRTINILFIFLLSLATVAFLFNWLTSATAKNDTPEPIAVTPSEEDIKFMNDAADAGLFEVTMGEYAKFQSVSDTVSDFARLLVTHYTKSNSELTNFAQKRNVKLATSMSDKMQKVYVGVTAKFNHEFNIAYCNAVIANHKESI